MEHTSDVKMNSGYSFVNLVSCLCLTEYIKCSGTTELILFPSYLQAELRGSVTFPLSWRQTSSSTLTVSQDIIGAQTDVFKINGTEYTVMNHWKSKTNLKMPNCTDICWVNVTMTYIALEDEGSYNIMVTKEGKTAETKFNTGRFQINTYALPIYTNIAVDQEQVDEGTAVRFTCTGNIGRPPGMLALVQSYSQNYSHTFTTVSVLDLPDSSREMLPNGTYRLQHDFHVNLTRSDNGTTFKCRNVHHLPNLSITESQDTAIILVNFTGLEFSSRPDKVVLGSTGPLTMRCSVEDNGGAIYVIKLKRETAPGSNTFEELAEFDDDKKPILNKDITNDKEFQVDGSFDNPAFLELTMNVQTLVCSDSKMYLCEAAFDNIAGKIDSGVKNVTLQVLVLPKMMPPLQAMKNGVNVYEGTSQSDKALFDVGNVLELTCEANIGSMNTTKIQWRKTTEMGSSFIQHEPTDGTLTHGPVVSDGQCGYTRTSTIRYNVTPFDSSYDLMFECYVSISDYPSSTLTPSGEYDTTNNLQFHLEVPERTSKAPSAASAGSGNVGAIAGGVVGGLVLIVIVVLLVYFLWYRRRSAGDDYTTKEEYGSENPNMAPPVDTYASADKSKKTKSPGNGLEEPLKPRPKPRAGRQELHYAELDLTKNPPVAPRKKHNDPVEYAERRGHENKGLDEPHESRRHHYSNGPGKSNFGMDRDADDYDDYDRDGSPTMTNQGISHMGMDPMDGRIGTGV